MKTCRCKFCNDLTNIKPAKYFASNSKEIQDFIKKADKKKKFILHYSCCDMEELLEVIDKCPVCEYEFTEEDYDSYDF